MVNSELLCSLIAPLAGYRLLPTAWCLWRAAGPPAGRGKLRAGPALPLPIADCTWGVELAGGSARTAVLWQYVTMAGNEQTV